MYLMWMEGKLFVLEENYIGAVGVYNAVPTDSNPPSAGRNRIRLTMQFTF